MACKDYSSIAGALRDMTGQAPLDAVVCPFAADYGLGLGVPAFALFVFGFVGLGLTVRTQHPGPIVIALVLSGALVGSTLPPAGLQVVALVIFFAIGGISLYIYQQAQRRL